MTLPTELAEMEADFLAGRKPLAYIPLGHALRKLKQYGKALELCQRGLEADKGSIAGRTLYVRLLNDLGRYDDAIRECDRAGVQAPGALGLTTEKVRALIRLRRAHEASPLMDALLTRNPFDPILQDLNSQLREQIRTHRGAASTVAKRGSAPPGPTIYSKEEMLAIIKNELSPVCSMESCALVSLGSGMPALDGDQKLAEVALQFWKGCQTASSELQSGSVTMGMMETQTATLIVLVRDSVLVTVGIKPTKQLGKVYHRLQTVVNQLLPVQPSRKTPPTRSAP